MKWVALAGSLAVLNAGMFIYGTASGHAWGVNMLSACAAVYCAYCAGKFYDGR